MAEASRTTKLKHGALTGLAVLLLAAGPAVGATVKAAIALRGPEPATAPAAPSPAAAQAAPDAGLKPPFDAPAPRFSRDAAPRIDGLAPPAGGAQCRQSCAADRYICRSDHEPDDCDPVWSQCVAGCPESSASAL